MKKAYSILVVILSLQATCSQGQVFPVDTLFKNGDLDKRINLVFLSDGYQASELDLFITDTNKILNDIFSQSPFKEYKQYFNAFAIKSASIESGASHPQNTADTDCLPVPIKTVNNYFGSSFDSFGIHRLLVPTKNVGSVLAINFPQYDQPFVVVNSPYYGGSGGYYATSSTHSSASEVSIHEIGHSFAYLADEYWAGAAYAAEKPNMTKQNDPLQVKWKNWLSTNSIGIYSYEVDPSWYRPHQNCKMKVLGVPFCSVCQETFAERIHALINPVLGYEPLVQELETTEGQDLTFSVSLLKPEPNTMKITWKKNEVVIDQNKDEITIPIGSFNTGDYSIKAEIMDTTALTRSDQHQIDHLYSIEWIVHSDHITGIEINSTELAYKIESFPNPLDEMFNLSYILPKASQVNITFQDERGRKTKSLISEKQPAGQYNYQLTPLEINARQSGLYVMILDINGTKIIRKIVKH